MFIIDLIIFFYKTIKAMEVESGEEEAMLAVS